MNQNFDDIDLTKDGYTLKEIPKRKYKCVKCGVATYNNQIIGSHCKICWQELAITEIQPPIQCNTKKWLDK